MYLVQDPDGFAFFGADEGVNTAAERADGDVARFELGCEFDGFLDEGGDKAARVAGFECSRRADDVVGAEAHVAEQRLQFLALQKELLLLVHRGSGQLGHFDEISVDEVSERDEPLVFHWNDEPLVWNELLFFHLRLRLRDFAFLGLVLVLKIQLFRRQENEIV